MKDWFENTAMVSHLNSKTFVCGSEHLFDDTFELLSKLLYDSSSFRFYGLVERKVS